LLADRKEKHAKKPNGKAGFKASAVQESPLMPKTRMFRREKKNFEGRATPAVREEPLGAARPGVVAREKIGCHTNCPDGQRKKKAGVTDEGGESAGHVATREKTFKRKT